MTTITITPAIEKEILSEVAKAQTKINKELTYPINLRNYASIESNAKYIKEMNAAIRLGVI